MSDQPLYRSSVAGPAFAKTTATLLESPIEMKPSVFQFDPLRDSRWEAFVCRHPQGSVFHSTSWLEALHRTYGYEPVVYTTSPPGAELANGIVMCKVRSWITGSRAVSLPFSDHCQPLVDDGVALNALLSHVQESMGPERWKYFELRPRHSDGITEGLSTPLKRSEHYLLHILDLRPDLDTLFRNLQKSSVQRKIRRAERERLEYQEGHSERLVRQFYDLMILTRRRHGIPPQPLEWFQNLIRSLQDRIVIRMALKDGQPIASILTISHERTMVYKYGCSDSKYHNLGGMALVFWKAIQDGKQSGAVEFDLGRSDCTNGGLISFKENWGAKPFSLDYLRGSMRRSAPHVGSAWQRRAIEGMFSRMPDSLLTAAGKLLYRHIG